MTFEGYEISFTLKIVFLKEWDILNMLIGYMHTLPEKPDIYRKNPFWLNLFIYDEFGRLQNDLHLKNRFFLLK